MARDRIELGQSSIQMSRGCPPSLRIMNSISRLARDERGIKMSIKDRLRLIPMLVDAYCEARIQIEAKQTMGPTPLVPVPNRPNAHAGKKKSLYTGHKSRKFVTTRISTQRKQSKNKQSAPGAVTVFPTNRRLIRELRDANSKSWNRLVTIQKKLQDVEEKVDGVNYSHLRFA